MALDDLFQITHNFVNQGVLMSSMFHVLRANAGENASSVNDSFANSVFPIIRLLQSDQLSNTDLVCYNLGDPVDFHTQTLATNGLRAVTNSPSFIAAAIRFPSLNRTIRSGQKRFAGMGEGDYTTGALIAATITLLTNIGTAMIGNWLASSDSHIVGNYVIIQRVCDEVDPVSGRCLQYRLPEIGETPVFYKPTAFIVNPLISSQVSRKTF